MSPEFGSGYFHGVALVVAYWPQTSQIGYGA
jgi:hypothetical protein